MSRKTAQKTRTWPLLLIGALILAAAWVFQNATGSSDAPSWLRSLFGPQLPLSGVSIALIAGHSGNDSGAVCRDGLTEASVNARITELAAERLQALGAQVAILEEFDDRLDGLRAAALISIHADSCEVTYSGFKVAGPQDDAADSQRLVGCLWEQYELATGLPRHTSTITRDMTEYHAFRQIAAVTPAAIIEVGFLGGDRTFLTKHPEKAADGLVNGIICFLGQEETH